MSQIFNQIFYQPIFNLLVFIYNILPGADFGAAIVILTILTRLAFVPLSLKTIRSQKEMAKLQPKIKELQERHKNDRQALSQATLDLYRVHKVNPFSGCLPLIIQLPILFALYRAFSLGLDPKSLDALYGFIKSPGLIKEISFGLLNLSHKNPILSLMAGGMQFYQSKLALAGSAKPTAGQEANLQIMSKQMLYFFPIMVIIISWNLPAGLVLYWVVTTIFSIGEQLYFNWKYR